MPKPLHGFWFAGVRSSFGGALPSLLLRSASESSSEAAANTTEGRANEHQAMWPLEVRAFGPRSALGIWRFQMWFRISAVGPGSSLLAQNVLTAVPLDQP